MENQEVVAVQEVSEIRIPSKRGRKPGNKGTCTLCGQVGHYRSSCTVVEENPWMSDRLRKKIEKESREVAEAFAANPIEDDVAEVPETVNEIS
jgi:hypothetical protein